MAEEFIRRCRPGLGTLVEIMVPAAHTAAADHAFAAIAHVHARMSFHDEASDLARLRRARTGDSVTIDQATAAVLRLSGQLHARSGGLFDVTVGSRLVSAGFLPRPPQVDLRLMTGTMADLEIIDDRHARCRRPMLIDLGGIAKGYAVDLAIEALLREGVPRALVNAGGDLRVFGGEPQLVHLRGADGELDGVLPLADGALASSSNRHLRKRRSGREITPHFAGGAPVIAASAKTVFAPTCTLADAMTKIALADPLLAAQMLDEIGGCIVERPAARVAA